MTSHLSGGGKRAVPQPAAFLETQVGIRPEPGEGRVVKTPFAPRQGAVVRSWWAKALERAVVESAYDERELRRGRTWARKAQVGQLTLGPGQLHAAVTVEGDVHTVVVKLPVLAPDMVEALVEVVASTTGWMGDLMRGELPRDLVEAAEEMGVELMPYGGEFDISCTCEPWADPCPHALAVLTQMTWWVDADPFVLTQLRGVGRAELMVRLHELSGRERDAPSVRRVDAGSEEGDEQPDQAYVRAGDDPWDPEDATVAIEAAERAVVILGEFTDE
ncbi:hypothetical protein [Nocardioides yefusunii]|uniref:SWIM-type domain-containing protein n=1 Tax=Nocardioides yefusunii TaxID=2500546 RepID=A0ABW1QY78_9ACTN|nr:hypothetical protein [Nocardioides yefusunii]